MLKGRVKFKKLVVRNRIWKEKNIDVKVKLSVVYFSEQNVVILSYWLCRARKWDPGIEGYWVNGEYHTMFYKEICTILANKWYIVILKLIFFFWKLMC